MAAIDEIQEIVTKAYIKFDVFQNKFYWSCQPAYNRNYVHFNYYLTANGVYMQDNINYARATRFNYTTGVYDESGMDGYVEVCYITGTGNNDFKILPLPDNRYPSLDLFTYHTGYKHRTNDKCRVRAVRRMN